MAAPKSGRFWKRSRRLFRWFRRAVLALLLLLLVVAIYLNRVGVPGFIKNPVIERLRARGVDLQMTRLSLHWYGLVAENVRFGRTNENAAMQLTARRVNVGLSPAALAHFQLQVDALEMRGGSLQWLIEETNRAPRTLAATNIQSSLRLLPNDHWALDNFQAEFAGARIQFTATITNASAIRDWPFLHAPKPAPAGAMQHRLRALADAFEKIHFSSPPTLILSLHGDARDAQSFAGTLTLNAPDAKTPWGNVSQFRFSTQLFSPTGNEPSHAELNLNASAAQTRWVTAQDIQLTARLVSTISTNIIDGKFQATARQIETPWAIATNGEFTAHWVHALTNAVPISGTGLLRLDQVHSRWGDAGNAHFAVTLARPDTNSIPAVDDVWSWWANFSESLFDFECQLADVKSPKLEAKEILCTGQWRPPELTVNHLDAKLYGGEFHGHAGLDVVSRELSFGTESHFDLKKTSPLLTEKARLWFSRFTWQELPAVTMNGTLTLPAWTNRQPDWRAEVRPTVRLEGQFQVNNGTFRGVAASSAQSHFVYSNMTWRLPDLHVTRPEGALDLVHEANDDTHDYYWHIHSAIDLRALRPLFETNQQRVFDLVSFQQPPVVDGEVRGRWYDYSRIAAQIHVAATNFTYRGEYVGHLQTDIEYTNRVLKMIAPRAGRGNERASADLVMIDWNTEKIIITNGLSTADPQAIARMLGSKTAHMVESYHFVEPPHARVNGVIPIHDDGSQNLVFELDGGPFQWWKFTVPHISGQVHWWGDKLDIHDIHAAFYDGSAAGEAEFDFAAAEGADFHFDFTVSDVNLHSLLPDLSARTNRLEGTLGGQLVVTSANTKNWSGWQGHGRAKLRDGLLWEIPVFGIFSPVLDGIVPGMGSSRVSDASAKFSITNSAILTDDLELRSTYMRLQYRGSVDFKGNLDARVEAEMLRDTWVVGRIVSLVLWPVSKIFEYRVTGVLHEPKLEPLYYVPKFLLMPLHPIRTIKELVPSDSGHPSTNAPPAVP